MAQSLYRKISTCFEIEIAKLRRENSNSYVICASFDLSIESMLVFIPKGWVTHKKDIQNDSTSPNVYCFSVRLFLQHLGTQVARSASETWNTNLYNKLPMPNIGDLNQNKCEILKSAICVSWEMLRNKTNLLKRVSC